MKYSETILAFISGHKWVQSHLKVVTPLKLAKFIDAYNLTQNATAVKSSVVPLQNLRMNWADKVTNLQLLPTFPRRRKTQPVS